jgi:hypothetical protein
MCQTTGQLWSGRSTPCTHENSAELPVTARPTCSQAEETARRTHARRGPRSPSVLLVSKTDSQKAREGRPCGICRLRPSEPRGEHVIPLGVRGLLFPEGGVYRTLPGYAQPMKQVDSVILDCCGSCNDMLERNFEDKGQAPALKLLVDPTVSLDAVEAQHVARWLVKTWLLLAHPATRYKARTPGPPPWDDAPTELFQWLIGPIPKVPTTLRMWVYGTPPTGLVENPSSQLTYLGHDARSAHFGIARIKGLLVFSPSRSFAAPDPGSLLTEITRGPLLNLRVLTDTPSELIQAP